MTTKLFDCWYNIGDKGQCRKQSYEGQSKKVDSYLLRRLTYTSEIWHIHAMNCPASVYAIYKTMQIIACCCLATEECKLTLEYRVAMEALCKI